jgi:hypothetical protein
MSDTPPDFGPAFPSMNDSGLTLRDYFAAAAWTGLCAAGNLATGAHHWSRREPPNSATDSATL